MANTEASPGNTTDFGDFVKDEEEELDLEELVEPWHRYDTEDNQYVLYPIHLGKVLNEKKNAWLNINLALVVAQLSGWHLTCKTRETWPSRSWP